MMLMPEIIFQGQVVWTWYYFTNKKYIYFIKLTPIFIKFIYELTCYSENDFTEMKSNLVKKYLL